MVKRGWPEASRLTVTIPVDVFNLMEEASRQAHGFHLLDDALPSRVITHGADEGYRVAQDSGVCSKVKGGSAQMFCVTEHVP